MYVLPHLADARTARHLARLFDGSIERLFAAPGAPAEGTRSPAMDVVESDADYRVSLELPGIRKEDVKVHIEGRQVRVQAERPAEPLAEGRRLAYRERSAVRFARHFAVAVEVDAAAADAQLADGVLTLTLPKRVTKTSSEVPVR